MHVLSLALSGAVMYTTAIFPPAAVASGGRDEARRCEIPTRDGVLARASVRGSECLLVTPRWVLTTAQAVAQARTLNGRIEVRVGEKAYEVVQLAYAPQWTGGDTRSAALLKLAEPVSNIPAPEVAGEFPETAADALLSLNKDRQWIARTIGAASPRGGDTARPTRAEVFDATKREPSFLQRIRLAFAGRGAARAGT